MGFCNCSMVCCVLLYVHSGFVVVLVGKGRPGCLAWSVFLVSCDCCGALPHGATGLSAVCDCGIS